MRRERRAVRCGLRLAACGGESSTSQVEVEVPFRDKGMTRRGDGVADCLRDEGITADMR